MNFFAAIVIIATFSMVLSLVRYWIKVHYRDHSLNEKQKRSFKDQDELLQYAQDLETRVQSLERILDRDFPQWRKI